jgi:Family of unknown function (DUF5677)
MNASDPSSSLTSNYSHQRDISNKLVSLSNKVLGGTLTDKKGFARKDHIFFGLTLKSLHTFEAIQILCEHSLVDDAFALVRVLIEGIINATVVLFGDDATADDYADFPDYKNWIDFQALENVAPEAVSTVPTAEVEEMKNRYEAVRMRYEKNLKHNWHRDNLFVRATTIDTQIGQNCKEMRVLVNSPWRTACQYVHGTAGSILSHITESGSGIIICRQVKTEETASLLCISNRAIFILLAVAGDRLAGKNSDEYRTLRAAWRGK